MYKLTILHPDLTLLEYSGNPYSGTLPDLVDTLSELVDSTQSYSTILAAIHERESYSRSYLDQVGVPCIAVIAPVLAPVEGAPYVRHEF